MQANRWTLFIAGPLFLILGVVAFLSFRFAQAEREDQAWVLHSYQVRDQLRLILSDVQDAETGQRGFIITRAERFLMPYRASRARIQEDLEKFRTLTLDNPEQQRRLTVLAKLVDERFTALDFTLDQVPASSLAATPQLAEALEAGRLKMDELRTEIAAAIAEEEKLLQSRLVARRLSEMAEVSASIGGALIALTLFIGAALLLVRNNRELEASEAQRTAQANNLQATLDNIRDGVAVFNRQGELVAFNTTFFSLLDFPQDLAVVGSELARFQEIDRTRDHAVFDEIPTVESEQGYKRVHLNARQLDVYRSVVPGGGFLIAAADITARVRAEDIVRQTQKMEAIGHLTGGVAHDFNNLLQIVSANLDLAASDMRSHPKTAERLQHAVKAVQRGSRLTGQLLAFARRQALEPRATNLGRLIPDMTDLLRRTLGERIEVEASVAGGLWNTLIDTNQLENAVLNLAINARDAMPDGGKLTIEVANAFLDDDYVAQHAEVTAGQYIVLAVSDTGTGIPEHILSRVFDPFFTTKPEGHGTGLGLSQVYGFVKQSGGHIKIYSEAGQGTVVKLYLPRTKKAQEEIRANSGGPVEGGTETILVVEDDADVRLAVVDLLSALGYQILKAENAEQALAVLRTGVHVDLLFTDVVMPGSLNTRDMARKAQELRPGLKILYTSGYTQNAIVHNGKLDDDVFLLSKPYRRDELARKLRGMLNAKKPPAAAKIPYRKVLVVEDVALIRMTTLDMIQEMGLETAEAGDGQSALDLLRADETIDVLLTDVGLPGMTGHQLVEEALRLRPGLKIIIASGYQGKLDGGTRSLGVVELMKPYDMTQLRRALQA